MGCFFMFKFRFAGEHLQAIEAPASGASRGQTPTSALGYEEGIVNVFKVFRIVHDAVVAH